MTAGDLPAWEDGEAAELAGAAAAEAEDLLVGLRRLAGGRRSGVWG